MVSNHIDHLVQHFVKYTELRCSKYHTMVTKYNVPYTPIQWYIPRGKFLRGRGHLVLNEIYKEVGTKKKKKNTHTMLFYRIEHTGNNRTIIAYILIN